MFYCRKNTHYLKLNPVRGSLSVAVGDTEFPTTPYGVAYRIQQYSDNPLKMNLLRRFGTAHVHPLATDRHPLTGMIHPAHHRLHRHRAAHQLDADAGGVAVDAGVGREARDGGYGRSRRRKERSWMRMSIGLRMTTSISVRIMHEHQKIVPLRLRKA